MPLGTSGEFVGTEDLDEDSIVLVYRVDVVPNNDDATQVYVNVRDQEKGEDLSEPGWAPPTLRGDEAEDQQVNDPDASWTQPEPVHAWDIQAKKDSETVDNG
jgi:hypothetical protein